MTRAWLALGAAILLAAFALPVAAASEDAAAASDERAVADEAVALMRSLAPEWTLPAAVTEPLASGDVDVAGQAAAVALDWVTSAADAQELLPELNALESIRAEFEAAQSLTDLKDGAALAARQEQAAGLVKEAKAKAAQDRDLLTNFGLWGVDVDAIVAEAVAAAVEGDVQEAINKSADAISKIDGGAGAGSLRLAGLVFFGVAVLGVLGLWVMLRRPPSVGPGGPPWATSG